MTNTTTVAVALHASMNALVTAATTHERRNDTKDDEEHSEAGRGHTGHVHLEHRHAGRLVDD